MTLSTGSLSPVLSDLNLGDTEGDINKDDVDKDLVWGRKRETEVIIDVVPALPVPQQATCVTAVSEHLETSSICFSANK
jgi:hypothetical protein